MASDLGDRPVDLTGCVVIREERFKALILSDERRKQLLREIQELHDMLEKSLASNTACAVWTRLKTICAANKTAPARKRTRLVERSKPAALAERFLTIPIYVDAGIKFLRREDLKKVLYPAAWKSLSTYCAGSSSHVDGPFLADVSRWLEGYRALILRP